MQKIEYKIVDLSLHIWSLNWDKKMKKLAERLNELGEDGWILVSGHESTRYALFMRVHPESGLEKT